LIQECRRNVVSKAGDGYNTLVDKSFQAKLDMNDALDVLASAEARRQNITFHKAYSQLLGSPTKPGDPLFRELADGLEIWYSSH